MPPSSHFACAKLAGNPPFILLLPQCKIILRDVAQGEKIKLLRHTVEKKCRGDMFAGRKI